MKETMVATLKKQRGTPPTPLELLVVLYVLGFIWEETQEILNEGIKSYLRNMWNFIDFSRNSLYCSVIFLRAVAYFQQMKQINQDPATAYIPRENWDDFDPQLIVNIIRICTISNSIKLIERNYSFALRLKDSLLLQTFFQLSNLSTCSR